MAKLTDILSSTNSRVSALENNDIDTNAGISRISKIYNNLKIITTVTIRVKTYLTPSALLFPSDNLFEEISF